MRIAYVCNWDAYAVDGVTAKINTQLAAWRSHGHDGELFCVSPDPGDDRPPSLRGRLFTFERLDQRAVATTRLMRSVRRRRPDAIYFRAGLWLPPAGPLLRSFPSAVEINGRANTHRLGASGRLFGADLKLNRRSMVRGASGFVCVSHELSRGFESLGKPVTVIGNCVDLRARPTLPPRRSDRLSFAMLVGADTWWHGVDKVLALAEAMPDCDFALIGADPSAVPGPHPPNCTLHPRVGPDEYEPLLARADVGIGALAMHRVGREENSSLKVPEYLAYGLPVMIAYEETDLVAHEPWYLLRLPNTESNVRDCLPEIRRFAERVRGRRVRREEIDSIVSCDVKEARRLAFIEQLVRDAAG